MKRFRALMLAVVASSAAACGGAPAEPKAPSRDGDPLAAALAVLPAPEPLLAGLSAAAKSDVDAALADLERKPAAKNAVARSPLAHPLLAAATSSSADALFALACRGGVSAELLSLRSPSSPRADLPGSVRRVARAAALSYARVVLTAIDSGRRPGVDELDRLVSVARALGDIRLRRVAADAARAASSTPERRLHAAIAAAESLDPTAAAAALTPEERETPAARETLDRARRLNELGGAAAPAESALEAASLAAALGRTDLLAALLTRSGASPSTDLRAAVVDALARLDGSTCFGLERSGESAELCPIAWRAHPDAAEVQRVLASAWSSGKGRDAWSIESYVGLAHVLPLSYGDPGPRGDPKTRAVEHLEAVRDAMNDVHAPPRGVALALVADLLRAITRAANGALLAPSDAQSLAQRAIALLRRAPEIDARRAALATAIVILPVIDPSELLDAIPPGGDQRAYIEALAAERWNHPERGSKALAALVASRSPAAGLFARELGASTGTDTTLAEHAWTALRAKGALDGFRDRVRASVDLVGALSQQGKREEAEDRYATLAAELAAMATTGDGRDVFAAFATEGDVLLAMRPERASRLRGAERLRAEMNRDRDLPPELMLYQALALRPLVERDETAECGKNERCLAAVATALEYLDDVVASAKRSVSPARVKLVEQGFLPASGAARTSIRYGVSTGVELGIEVEPAVLVMPRPK
jgi:hypothetical protein